MSIEEIVAKRKERKDYLKERMKKDYEYHVATHTVFKSEDGQIEYLLWKKPGTSNYMVTYIIAGGYLYVSGDLGEAIYQWSDRISFEWLAKLDLYYFSSKCQASEYGRGYKEWCSTEAEEDVKIMLEEASENGDCVCTEEDEECKCFEKHKKELWDKFKETRGDWNLRSKEEWHMWCQESAEEVLGPDWWESVGQIGEIISPRCELHLLGLKMADAKLKVNKEELE